MDNEVLQKLNELSRQLESLKSTVSIPKNIDEAFRSRFDIENRPVIHKISTTEKAANSENHGAGAAGLGEPDGFIKLKVDGAYIALAYWTI